MEPHAFVPLLLLNLADAKEGTGLRRKEPVRYVRTGSLRLL